MRRQLPVNSPVSLTTIAAAVSKSIGGGQASRAELANLIGREYSAESVMLCGSGTQALCLAIAAARRIVGEDAIVALPAFTCFDVASAAVGAGGSFSLYDINPASLAPDADSLGEALDHGSMIVVVAPLYGIPIDWERVKQIAASRGALLIEDAAQGHGASYRGQPLGSLGDISTLSFGRGKGWTGGSGGAVLFRRGKPLAPELADPGVSSNIASAIKLAAQWSLGRPALYGIPSALPGLSLGETVYHAPTSPRRMSESAAAGILESRAAAIREAEVRRTNARWIRNQLGSQRSLREITSEARESVAGYIRFPILAPRGLDGFGAAAPALGIARSYPKCIGELPALARSIVGAGRFSGAERLAEELVTLPVHSLVSDSDRNLLARGIGAYAP